MPTATLTFNLPDEAKDHLCAVHGASLKSLLWAIKEEIHKELKHMEPDDPIYSGLERAQKIFNESAEDYQLSELINS